MKDEFQLIEKLLARTSLQTRGNGTFIRVPAGDDACLLSGLKNPVVTTDTQRNNVHFKLSWQTPEEVGEKAVATTLSDLAASYATPVSLFVNLAVPPSVKDDILEAIYTGIKTALVKYECSLGGGNVSVGRDLSLDMFAVGEGSDTIFPLRSAAKDGFGVYSTGPLGLAAAGLDALKRKESSFQRLISSFKHPTARFDAADVLLKHGVPCVMDISDGLAGDAGHVAKASDVTIKLSVPEEYIDPDLTAYCRKYDLIPENMVISGGEDYELLFACEPEIFENVKKDLPGTFKVGDCLPYGDEYIIGIPSEIKSFRHGTCAKSDS